LKYVLTISAASFIYIAVADLVPKVHRRTRTKSVPSKTLPIIAFFHFEH